MIGSRTTRIDTTIGSRDDITSSLLPTVAAGNGTYSAAFDVPAIVNGYGLWRATL
jgi:hypothetical protein